jgi:hypothetical protein
MQTIYTIGYTGLKLGDLTVWMDAHNAVLVDTRLNAYSPNPDWKKFALQRTFSDNYRHVQSLGNLNYKGGGGIALKDEEDGVKTVAALLAGQPVVLLCTCASVDRCHRKVAAEAIAAATGAPIHHLTPAEVRAFAIQREAENTFIPPPDWDTPGAQIPEQEGDQPGLPGFGVPTVLKKARQDRLL